MSNPTSSDIYDKILEAIGGMDGAMKLFGWQGGTMHDAKRELERRLKEVGLVDEKRGGSWQSVALVIGEWKEAEKHVKGV